MTNLDTKNTIYNLMKTIFTTSFICLMSLLVCAQTSPDPVALQYSIGSFKIGQSLDNRIDQRFSQLDPNRSYLVTIVGSADFLGAPDNNQVLSNKRVKFAEYHLLKNYSHLRLIVKLDSKGEMNATDRVRTQAGIQEHRMVYIYIQDYNPSAPIASASPRPIPVEQGADHNSIHGRTIATSAAAQAEDLQDIPVSVSQETIKPLSETARIEIAKQEAERRRLADLNNNSSVLQSAGPTQDLDDSKPRSNVGAALNSGNAEPTQGGSGTLNVAGNKEPKKFESDGTFSLGERLLLSDLNFRPGSHYLRPSSIPSLRKLIDVLEANPALKIEIIGHICCHPDYSVHPDGFDREAGNHKLSYNRANNIKEYLQKNGIDGSRLAATGMGAQERLVFPEETDDDRIKNRRVEIKIIAL